MEPLLKKLRKLNLRLRNKERLLGYDISNGADFTSYFYGYKCGDTIYISKVVVEENLEHKQE